MTVFCSSQLEELAIAIFMATGAPPDIARQVSASLVLANLCGHDSHGVIRIPSYVHLVEDGTVVPAARPSILSETPTTATVDGNWAFGMATSHFVTRLAIEKAKTSHVAVVSAVRCNHTGRLGEYTEIAAREGMVAILTNSGFDGGLVAPYGGLDRVLTSNPISMAMPAGEGWPVVADMSTSAIAEGKLQVARAKGEAIPPGCILDRNGNPSTNAQDFYDGGVILPFGGQKSSALSTLVEMLSKHLAGAERVAKPGLTFGVAMIVIDASVFRPLEELQAAVDETRNRIRHSRPAQGFEKVLSPGDRSQYTMVERSRNGIDVPEETVNALRETAERLGVDFSSLVDAR